MRFHSLFLALVVVAATTLALPSPWDLSELRKRHYNEHFGVGPRHRYMCKCDLMAGSDRKYCEAHKNAQGGMLRAYHADDPHRCAGNYVVGE